MHQFSFAWWLHTREHQVNVPIEVGCRVEADQPPDARGHVLQYVGA
jgi:hypothetical protein